MTSFACRWFSGLLGWLLALFAIPIVYAAGLFCLLWMRRLMESGAAILVTSTVAVGALATFYVTVFTRPWRIVENRRQKILLICAFVLGSVVFGVSATIALDEVMPEQLFAGHVLFRYVTIFGLWGCLGVTAGHWEFRSENIYTGRQFSARLSVLLGAALIVSLAIWFSSAPAYEIRAMKAVRGEKEKLTERMELKCREYEASGLKKLTVPHTAFSDYAAALQRIDLRGCPTEFQNAFREYANAWADFGEAVERNSGAQGIIRAVMTDGLSVLDAWFVQFPEKQRAIKDAVQRLEMVTESEVTQAKKRTQDMRRFSATLFLSKKALAEFMGAASDELFY